MAEFKAAHAVDGTPAMLVKDVARQLGRLDGYNLGFVYATSQLAGRLGEIVQGLAEQTGVADWVGTVGFGVCGTGVEHFGHPALSTLACRMPPAAHELVRTSAHSEAVAPAANLHGSQAATYGFGVVHGDPRDAGVIDGVAALAARKGVFLVGGLTAAEAQFPQIAGREIVEGGISGVLLGGGLEVAVGLTQGCSPIGPLHEVSASQGEILIALDGRRALDVLAEDAGLGEEDDPRAWLGDVHVAVPIAGSDRSDYLVRNLIGIDPKAGLVAISHLAEAGDKVMFVRRDAASAIQDLKRMLGEVGGRLSRQPQAGLYYSCVARGPNLFREPSRELKAIQEAFGDIPISGFFGNGEISHNRVYGYTGVLTLFA